MNDVTQIRKMPPFPSRGLLIASVNMLKFVGHSGFEALRLEWDLQDTDAGTGNGLMARATVKPRISNQILGRTEFR